MSHGFRIFDDRLAGPLHGWGPQDFWRFSWAAARGAGPAELAGTSGLDERAVAWLLDEPVVARLVRSYAGCAGDDDEAFCRRLRPLVRRKIESELNREPTDLRLLVFCSYCIDVIGRDPARRGVELLLASLREKRRTFRRRRRTDAASASSATPAIPPGSHRMRPCPTPEAPDATHEELAAEAMTRTLRSGERALVRAVVGDLVTAGSELFTLAVTGVTDEDAGPSVPSAGSGKTAQPVIVHATAQSVIARKAMALRTGSFLATRQRCLALAIRQPCPAAGGLAEVRSGAGSAVSVPSDAAGPGSIGKRENPPQAP